MECPCTPVLSFYLPIFYALPKQRKVRERILCVYVCERGGGGREGGRESTDMQVGLKPQLVAQRQQQPRRRRLEHPGLGGRREVADMSTESETWGGGCKSRAI
jgi:hypothetical protein